MPIIAADVAPTFELGSITFTGLAAPSRGSTENAVWRVRLTSAEPGAAHTLDREEVLVALSGRAVVTLDGAEHVVAAGDAVVVSSTLGASAERVTAISLLAGVEPILTKPGSKEMSLGGWSLEPGASGQ